MSEDISRLRQQAEQGNMAAQCQLGDMYFHGRGVPIVYIEAAKWFQKAANQGSYTGLSMLCIMYRDGLGVPKNAAKADEYYRRCLGRTPTKSGGVLLGMVVGLIIGLILGGIFAVPMIVNCPDGLFHPIIDGFFTIIPIAAAGAIGGGIIGAMVDFVKKLTRKSK